MLENRPVPSATFIQLFILFSGCAALSWEVVWQLKTGLAFGVSAWGAAVTLAITMGGMAAGALGMGYALRRRASIRPVRLYGVLECIVGLSGFLLVPAFGFLAAIDIWAYNLSPASASLVYALGLSAILGIPTLCLGATLPVIGLAAQKFKTSIALLYGLNTLGAAAGALLAAFALIPLLGVTQTAWTIAVLNLAVGVTAMLIDREPFTPGPETRAMQKPQTLPFRAALLIAFITGFATFVLEVSWFRSLTAAFKSTTDAFAIMLACVLIALGLGARMVPFLKRRGVPLGVLLATGGILILLATPLIERFDMVAYLNVTQPWAYAVKWFFMTLYTIGLPVFFLGIALPWLLDEQQTPHRWGILYGINALAAILGALCAAWLLLPAIGFAATAWLSGLLVAAAGILIAAGSRRPALAGLTAAALLAAIAFESGAGRTRVQTGIVSEPLRTAGILRFHEGPDATISAVETEGGHRMLVINGFVTTVQVAGDTSGHHPAHYMPWMGHLPMLLHPDPQDALVICFGTGQTANAVRREQPQSLDIVDLNKHVFEMADVFTANENVLADPIVNTIVMDGRAYIKRTQKTYDIITLEPMPPNFAGVNALYSQEFYRAARNKLKPGGIIAQWLPFHLVPAKYSAAIARTMQSVFPNTILWIDPLSGTGILAGVKGEDTPLGTALPGYGRDGIARDMSAAAVKAAIAMTPDELAQYAAAAEIVTDDNQLLAYGRAVYLSRSVEKLSTQNHQYMEAATGKDFSRYFPYLKTGK